MGSVGGLYTIYGFCLCLSLHSDNGGMLKLTSVCVLNGRLFIKSDSQ